MVQVSVIIPMYNEERYIARCLDSLLMQTINDMEIILIDDGSADKSIPIASSYKDKMSLTLLEQQHGGPGKARNRGASIAKGEILVFVDADMVFDKEYISELIGPIVSGAEVCTTHGREYIANKEHPIARGYGNIRVAYDEKNPRSGVFRAIKKDVFLQHEGYDSSRFAFEDNISESIGKALYIPGAICYHNNPETFGEIFSHEKWIGASLLAKNMLQPYLKKYALPLLIVILVGALLIRRLTVGGMSLWMVILTLLGFMLILCIILGVKRAIKEGYIRHVIYVPAIMIVRGIGYITGMLQYLFIGK